MSVRELKKLAGLVFKMTRRSIWLGGKISKLDYYSKTQADMDWGDWPASVERPRWTSGLTWTLSPELELGGHRVRVCVSSGPPSRDPLAPRRADVHIFADGRIIHPGGKYTRTDRFWFLWESWEGRLARLERYEGGRTGPVDRRDLLIAEAEEKLKGVQVKHSVQDPRAIEAVREVEALVNTGRLRQEEG